MKFHQDRNPKYTEISLYVIFTVIVIYLLSKLADHIPEIFSWSAGALRYVGNILTPLIAGFVIAYLLHPVVNFLGKQLATVPFFKKNNRNTKTASIVLTYLLVAVALIVILSLLISAVTHQIALFSFEGVADMLTSITASVQSFYRDLNDTLNRLNISSDELREVVNNLGTYLGDLLASTGSSLTMSLTNLTGFVTSTVFAIILSIYFLMDRENLSAYWDRVLKALTPKSFYTTFHQGLKDMDFAFSGYIRGQLIDAVIMGFLISISLSLVGVQFSLLIGILAGIGNLIPYVGPLVAYVLTTIVTFVEGDIRKLIIALIVLLVVQTIDGNIINPRLLSDNTNVHPMLVIVALLFGNTIGGIGGMLLAVPVAALLKIWFDRMVQHFSNQRQEHGTP